MHQDSACSWATRHSSGITWSTFSSSVWVSSTGTSLRGCFQVVFLIVLFRKFPTSFFFFECLEMKHVLGNSTNNSLAAMLDPGQPCLRLRQPHWFNRFSAHDASTSDSTGNIIVPSFISTYCTLGNSALSTPAIVAMPPLFDAHGATSRSLSASI